MLIGREKREVIGLNIKKYLLLIIMVLLLPISVYAEEDQVIDTTKKCTITGTYAYDEDVLTNVNTKIYKLADIDASAKYTYLEEFKTLEKDINSLKTSEYVDYSKSVSEFIKKNNVKELASSTTDKDGKFYYKNLDVGLYLIEVEEMTKNGYYYQTNPTLVTVPNRTYLYEEYSYDIVTLVKGSKNKVEDSGVPNTYSNMFSIISLVLIVFLVSSLVVMYYSKKDKIVNE